MRLRPELARIVERTEIEMDFALEAIRLIAERGTAYRAEAAPNPLRRLVYGTFTNYVTHLFTLKPHECSQRRTGGTAATTAVAMGHPERTATGFKPHRSA